MKADRSLTKLLFLTPIVASQGLMVYAAGTIAFANGPLTPMQRQIGLGGSTAPVSTNAQIVYGVFWGTNRNDLTLALPLGSSSTVAAGLIVAPSVYPIEGTEAGQTVYLQIKGWSAAYGMNWQGAQNSFADFGQTPIAQVTLGFEAGPGAVIWQSTSGTNPNRFYPLTLGVPLTPPLFVSFGYPPTNSSVIVDEGSQGVIDAVFTINRIANGPPSYLDAVTSVLLWTTNMTAVAGQDYVPTNVLVTFGPGETVQQVAIQVTGDALSEPDEQFGVRLTPTSSVVGLFNNLVVTIREARVVSVRRESNQAVVTIRTTSSQRYALESSPDFMTWSTTPGADSIAGTGTNVEVTDVSAGCCGHRFYRTRLVR